MEIPTEFFAAYAWNPQAWPASRLPDYLREWAGREFGAGHAAEIAAIVERYTRYNARRHPEQLDPDTYSLTSYDEAERVVADYNQLAIDAGRIGKTLPANLRDAYFQLVEYPVRASANALDMLVSAGRNRLYARQGRVTTNDMAARVRQLFQRDADLARQYEQGVSGGKWKHMMSQTRFGYTNWDQPYRDVMPAVSELRVPAPGHLAAPNGIHKSDRMGVAIQGEPTAWPVFPPKPLVLPTLSVFEKQPRHVEVFNRGGMPFDYTIKASHPWIRLSHQGGRVSKDQRILVDVDWNAAPAGLTQASLTIDGPDQAHIVVQVPVHKPADLTPGSAQGHVESQGVVAIEAEHYSRAHAPSGRQWLTIPGYGRTLSGVTTVPAAQAPLGVADGMHLDYDVYLFKSGEVRLHAILGPTLKFQPGTGFRYAVSIDGEAPTEVNVHADQSEQFWSKAVSNNAVDFATTHRIATPGRHTVKFWALDPGLVLQRLVIDAGGMQPSYLGPQESPYYPVRDGGAGAR